ncbi:DUF2065 domain-containing protein [Salinimonas sediminis]|uniref:DUF2065 domain-containing protein n=1 Tax=Salinimonas sediminis TaxID=2303538 RepID=A0A346NIA8_9ALTE|nr:DUF2065 domain-containing protein [Salinimonas sediminis]AXR05265.1 DUF2065 domain-containing protein [Salinimonas sediminis]
MQLFLLALAIVLIIEGLGPMLMPHRWRLFLLEMSQQPSETLRKIGGIMVVAGGVTLYWFWP